MPPKGISRKETLQNVFGSNWETFVDKMPKWEQDLVSFDVVGLDRMLVLGGLNIPDAANALHKYFGTRKRSREDGLPWNATLYDDICNAEESKPDGPESTIAVLDKKGAPWPGMTGNRLLVRKWNTDFWPKYQASFVERTKANDLFKVAIMGTPGIGKTVGLCYILHQYLTAADAVRTKRFVVLILPNDGDFYLFDTQDREVCQVAIEASKSGLNALTPFRNDLLVLHDIGRERPMTPNNIPTVLATSPKYDIYNEFMKGCDERFYIPPFSDEEMSFAAKHLFPDTDYAAIVPGATKWEHVAYYFGNVPRDVFLGQRMNLIELEKQLASVKRYSLVRLRGINPCETAQDVNDRLLIYMTSPDYTHYSLQFRKGYVAEELSKALIFGNLGDWHRIADFTQNRHVLQSVLHEFLASFPAKLDVSTVRLLKPNGVTPQQQSTAQTLLRELWPPATTWTPNQFCEGTRVELKTQHVHYLLEHNLSVVDSFVFCRQGSNQSAHLLCFQMTIAQKHRTTVSNIQKFMNDFNKSFVCTVQGASRDAKIIVAEDGSCTLSVGETALPLEVHIVYVTNPTDDNFGYQTLKNNTAMKWKQFWGRVHQYQSGQRDR